MINIVFCWQLLHKIRVLVIEGDIYHVIIGWTLKKVHCGIKMNLNQVNKGEFN